MVPVVTEATCCHAQRAYNLYSWVLTCFLNMQPDEQLNALTRAPCKSVPAACARKDDACCVKAMFYLKAHDAVITRLHTRHVRALAGLHRECCDMAWQEVLTLKKPLRDLSRLIYKRVVERFWKGDTFAAPVQMRTTIPHVIMSKSIRDQKVNMAREQAWTRWKAWFLGRIQEIRERRAQNAQNLLHALNW